MAAYAGILDGHSLWLAVEATPGTLALRDSSGAVHPLVSDLPEDDPAYRSVRADLSDLLAQADPETAPVEVAYDVVLVPTGGGTPRPVWSDPLPRRPTRALRTPDGRWQLSLARNPEGLLRVRRRRPVPVLEVLDLGVDTDGVRVSVTATDATHLDLVEDGTVVASYPLAREGDRCVAVLTVAGLPGGTGQRVRVLAGDLPLRRQANELANPHAAVLMPVLIDEETGHARLRLRWAPDATLAARVVDDEDES